MRKVVKPRIRRICPNSNCHMLTTLPRIMELDGKRSLKTLIGFASSFLERNMWWAISSMARMNWRPRGTMRDIKPSGERKSVTLLRLKNGFSTRKVDSTKGRSQKADSAMGITTAKTKIFIMVLKFLVCR
jgi:hypothetical protein